MLERNKSSNFSSIFRMSAFLFSGHLMCFWLMKIRVFDNFGCLGELNLPGRCQSSLGCVKHT
jgi:hypothetical protein